MNGRPESESHPRPPRPAANKDPARTAAYDFNHHHAVMGLAVWIRSIAQTTLHASNPNVIGSAQIVINRLRHPERDFTPSARPTACRRRRSQQWRQSYACRSWPCSGRFRLTLEGPVREVRRGSAAGRIPRTASRSSAMLLSSIRPRHPSRNPTNSS
jgi:hypothetical protein